MRTFKSFTIVKALLLIAFVISVSHRTVRKLPGGKQAW
jgi:hypothetical protein